MKRIPLLPNLITTGNLFFGFLAILSCLRGDYLQAAWCILAAMIFDFFDGQIARLQKASSAFGLEYDSLADLVSFGVAPAILVYQLALRNMGRIGVAVAFLYVACATMRLARFNVSKPSNDKRFFQGLPTPGAAGLIGATLILQNEIPEIYTQVALIKFYPVLLLLVAVLMVSNVRYPATQSIDTLAARPFINLVLVVAGGALVLFHLEIFVFLCFFLYVMSGLAEELHLQHQKRKAEEKLQSAPHQDIKTLKL